MHAPTRFAELFTPAPARRPVRDALKEWMPVARMMGLTLGDGTEIGSIRKGDGTAIEEVRKGDGEVVWSGDATPDSAILQLPLDDGTGTSFPDAIGTNDGSALGDPTWVSDASLNGGFGLSLDGSGDAVELSTDSRYAISESFSFGITVELHDTSSEQIILNHITSSSDIWGIDVLSGSIRAGYYDGTSYFSTAQASAPSSRTRVLFVYDGSGISLYLNTSEATGTGSPSLSTTTGFDIGYSSGSNNEYADMLIDNPIGYNTALGSSGVQQDYDGQPWT